MEKFKSFQFVPESMTIIEHLEEEDGAVEEYGRKLSFFMPIEEAGRTFALVLQEDSTTKQYDYLNLYEINTMETCSDCDSASNWGCVLVSKKFLYDKLEKHGFAPEDNSFEKTEKQKILYEAYKSALAS